MRSHSFLFVLTALVFGMIIEIVGYPHNIGVNNKIVVEDDRNGVSYGPNGAVWATVRPNHRPGTTLDDLKSTVQEVCAGQVITTTVDVTDTKPFDQVALEVWVLEDRRNLFLSGRGDVSEMAAFNKDLRVDVHDVQGRKQDEVYQYNIRCDKALVKIKNHCAIFSMLREDPVMSSFCIEFIMYGII